uniref:Uncharacterized protein n=1 Tax=Parascaris univalens TaxID=6257 RepID=A0A915BUU3_PARUN
MERSVSEFVQKKIHHTSMPFRSTLKKRLSANKPSTASMVGERRSVEGAVRFRNLNDTLMWTSVDAVDCDVNAVVYRGRYSEDDDERRRANSVGKFTVTSEHVYNADISLSDAEVRMIVSISQLEKRGKMKHTDIGTFITIHRKSLAKEDYVIVYRSPKIMEVTSTSLHKFPEIIIAREKLLGGANDRQIRFTLHSAANGDAIGEAEILYSQLITDGKVNLRLHSRDLNGNTLFGVSKRTLHHVGVLHVNAFLDSCTMSSSSRGSSSSTVSTTSTQESRVRSLKDDEEPKEKSNVMMASGRTQAYLISLLAPTVDIRLRPPFPNRSSEHLMDRSYYK